MKKFSIAMVTVLGLLLVVALAFQVVFQATLNVDLSMDSRQIFQGLQQAESEPVVNSDKTVDAEVSETFEMPDVSSLLLDEGASSSSSEEEVALSPVEPTVPTVVASHQVNLEVKSFAGSPNAVPGFYIVESWDGQAVAYGSGDFTSSIELMLPAGRYLIGLHEQGSEYSERITEIASIRVDSDGRVTVLGHDQTTPLPADRQYIVFDNIGHGAVSNGVESYVILPDGAYSLVGTGQLPTELAINSPEEAMKLAQLEGLSPTEFLGFYESFDFQKTFSGTWSIRYRDLSGIKFRQSAVEPAQAAYAFRDGQGNLIVVEAKCGNVAHPTDTPPPPEKPPVTPTPVPPTETPEPTPTVPPTVPPTETPEPTPTTPPTETPEPTPTVPPTVPPTETPEPSPTPTVPPTVPPTETPEPSPTPTVPPCIDECLTPTVPPPTVPVITPTPIPEVTPTPDDCLKLECEDPTVPEPEVPEALPTIIPDDGDPVVPDEEVDPPPITDCQSDCPESELEDEHTDPEGDDPAPPPDYEQGDEDPPVVDGCQSDCPESELEDEHIAPEGDDEAPPPDYGQSGEADSLSIQSIQAENEESTEVEVADMASSEGESSTVIPTTPPEEEDTVESGFMNLAALTVDQKVNLLAGALLVTAFMAAAAWIGVQQIKKRSIIISS